MKKLSVLYVCPDPGLGGSTRSLIQMIESLRESVDPTVLLPREELAAPAMRDLGIPVFVIPFSLLHESPGILSYFLTDAACERKISKTLSGKKIDLIHTNCSSVTIGESLSRRLKVPHVWHIREFLDLDFNFDVTLGIPRLQKKINRADARIAVSAAIREHWRLKEENTHTLWNPIGRREQACFYEKKSPYFLFCSFNITERKGSRLAVQAFGLSGLCQEGMRLRLVGNCSEQHRQTLLETASEYGCATALDFIPLLSDTREQFAHATAFIMASQSEAFGRTTAEAMFYGCPVIGKASGGTLDLIRDKQTGYLFHTPEACAQQMKEVCHTPQRDIIEAARQFIITHCSQEAYAPQILKVYESVL